MQFRYVETNHCSLTFRLTKPGDLVIYLKKKKEKKKVKIGTHSHIY